MFITEAETKNSNILTIHNRNTSIIATVWSWTLKIFGDHLSREVQTHSLFVKFKPLTQTKQEKTMYRMHVGCHGKAGKRRQCSRLIQHKRTRQTGKTIQKVRTLEDKHSIQIGN